MFSNKKKKRVMAEKNIIYSEFSDINLFKLSSPYRLKKIFPVVKNSLQFEDILLNKYSDKYKKQILDVKKEMYAENFFYENQCKKTTEELMETKK